MPPKKNHTHREFEARLGRILRHAARVFSEKGFEGASIRDISRASGVSLAGLYHYFRSKQELLYLIQRNTFTSVLKRLEKRLSGVTDAPERLRLLVSNHVDYSLAHRIEMKVLAHEEDALEEPYRRELVEIKRRYYQIAREIFEELRRTGMAGRLSPRIAVLSLFGMMNWIHMWYNPQADPQAERIARTMYAIFLRGIAPAPSAPRIQATEAATTPADAEVGAAL